jgi:hypothetical protein
MHKTKDDLLDYQAIVSEIKSATLLTAEHKDTLLKALADSFYNGNELPEDSPEREKLDDIVELFVWGGD